ncbi:MAG: hypothetical protein GOVbin4162_134 [Prokaryotic dsDNA virus sp.]|nr:MAG: hypothetical protein GOVbin4162_134 [Prokaryotic dsDNA virus sp.]|tara:strand:- start:1934 stop:2218 length:285 start_codon:yes stop_codon:yes gene_type:complete
MATFNHKVAIDLAPLEQKQITQVREMFDDMGLEAFSPKPIRGWRPYYVTNINLSGKAGKTYFYCQTEYMDSRDRKSLVSFDEFEELYLNWKESK